MCPNCRAFISRDDRVCPYCGMELRSMFSPSGGSSARAGAGSGGGLIPEHYFTTVMLLLINSVIFLLSVVISGQEGNGPAVMNLDVQTLVLLGAKFTPWIRDANQWWRLITAGFLHGGILHILMNSWAMFGMGVQLDVIFGSARYLVIYFCGTVAGFWASYFFSPQSISVGASAGLCGMVGAMIAVGFLSRSSLALQIRSGYLRYAGMLLLIGALGVFGRIDNMAHLGGIVGGFASAMVVGLPRPGFVMRERMSKLAAWVCVLITVFAFVQMVLFYRVMHVPKVVTPPVMSRPRSGPQQQPPPSQTPRPTPAPTQRF